MATSLYDYGECHVCGAKMVERVVKQDFWIKGSLIVIDNVPTGVCPECGEKVVNAITGRKIDEIIRNTERIEKAPRISVPVISFDSEFQQTG